MTHKQRVLQLLKDGKPHSHHELYQLGCVAHSRISDLRRDGHRIKAWRDKDLYLYKLEAASVASTEPPVSNQAPLEAADSISGRDGAGVLSHSSPHRPAARTAPYRGADPGSIPGAGVLTLFEATA